MRLVVLIAGAAVALVSATPAAFAAQELSSLETCSEVVDYAGGGEGLLEWPAWSQSENGTLGFRPIGPAPTPQPTPAPPVAGSWDFEDQGDVVPDVEDESASVPEDNDVSGTNTQELGIDEPDFVKTDGRLLYVFARDELRVVTARTDEPRAIGRLSIDITDGQLLRHGDKLLVIGHVPVSKPDEERFPRDTYRDARRPVTTRLVEIDVSDPTAPKVLRTLDAPGTIVASRQLGSTVRVVVNTENRDGWRFTQRSDDGQATVPVGLDLDDVVPVTRLRSAVTGARYARRMAPCDQISAPAEFSGNDLVSVFTFDLGRGLVGIRREAVMANAQVVYASSTTLYLASGRSIEDGAGGSVPAGTFTDIHAFDIRELGETNYLGSGRVLGVPLSRYAFSEWNGHLRVATTTRPSWLDDADEAGSTENRVTVLRQEGTGFVQTGLVDGLGKTERIYAMRFDGPRGYMVTFRETDPLYTLDLEDPAAPKMVGELKIPGYSAYLHPLGDGYLLGIGRDGRDDGTLSGAAVSLFDVSDPAQPRRIAQRNLGRGWARAEDDPHAFLWWPRRKLALVPYMAESEGNYEAEYEEGVMVGFTVNRASDPNLKELGRIQHGPAWDHPNVARAVVVGERLLTVSRIGVATHRVGDLSPIGFLPYFPYVQDLDPAPRQKCAPTGPVWSTPAPLPTVASTPAPTPEGTTPGPTPTPTPRPTRTPEPTPLIPPKPDPVVCPTPSGTAPATTPSGTTPNATTPGRAP